MQPEKKKLLVVSELYWPEKGGAELATHLILNILKQKMDITVVTGTACPQRLDSVRYLYSDMLHTSNKILLWENLAVLTRMRWFIKLVEDSDAVYIPRCSYPVISLAKKKNKRVIVHVHNYQLITYCSLILNGQDSHGLFNELERSVKFEMLENKSSKKALLSPLMSPLNQLAKHWNMGADEIICVSNKQREIISSAVPTLSRKLKVIRNPLPQVPPFEKRTGDPLFLYLGGDSYIKGFSVFLQSSQRLLNINSRAKFLLLGKYEKASGVAKSVGEAYQTLGYVNNKDVWSLYSKSHALLFPSITEEPLPYAIVEAMLSGTIPIASAVGGVPEIVQGTFASKVAFEPGDVEGLVERMEQVLSLPKQSLADIGMDLRENILEKFNADIIGGQLLETFA